MSAAAELQKAVFASLTGDAALSALTGGPKIVDHAPANVPFPYVSFGRTTTNDWSTSTEEGAEHLFTLNVWSKAKGRAQALAIAEAVRARLHDADLTLETRTLVNLRHESGESGFNDEEGVHHASLRFRAVTEAAT